MFSSSRDGNLMITPCVSLLSRCTSYIFRTLRNLSDGSCAMAGSWVQLKQLSRVTETRLRKEEEQLWLHPWRKPAALVAPDAELLQVGVWLEAFKNLLSHIFCVVVVVYAAVMPLQRQILEVLFILQASFLGLVAISDILKPCNHQAVQASQLTNGAAMACMEDGQCLELSQLPNAQFFPKMEMA
ncbi:hypothetical protein E2562_015046 [Oryza meyeriana var. granulata]|uniref:Uncharacterized protein n=1 Tax=Oryza meyeriana var. granulata TaxID=110450 RepID=A0A6G1ELS6_9ORYZ|nr:hypothetical protein E2562_015046 [Oryza meyeriana var. granulata]